ncbi:MAG: ATP-binding protein, partial [Gemmatimonadaceae bacterium]
HGERVLGVLQAQSYRQDAYTWDDVDLIMLIARQAGTAIVNARLFEAERHEREQAEAAAGIARATLRAATMEEAATVVLRILQSVAPSSGAALAVVMPGGQGLRCIAARGSAAALHGVVVPFPGRDEEKGVTTRVVCHDATGNPSSIVVTHSALDEPLTVVPLSSGSHPIGALLVTPATDPGLARAQSARLERLAASMALTLDTMLLREDERHVAEQLRQSEKLAALGELVAGVAHEVNNPLTGISAFAQLLQEDPLSSDQMESVQLIKREADRAVAVIRDLLTFARKTGPRNVPVDLNDLIEQTLRLRAYGIRTAGITVSMSLDPALRAVQGDDRQLQQVLLNLVVNAEHAMAVVKPRALSIRTANDADRVVVEVSDSGAGMSPEVQKRIFEPFFTTKPEGKGTGLGLSVSYGIVQTHHGTLTVQSAPGSGTTFRVSLPAEVPPVATPSSSGSA